MKIPDHFKIDVQIKARLLKKDIAYVVGLFESYENLAVVRTVNSNEGIIELLVSPSFISETKELLESLKKEVHLEIIEDK